MNSTVSLTKVGLHCWSNSVHTACFESLVNVSRYSLHNITAVYSGHSVHDIVVIYSEHISTAWGQNANSGLNVNGHINRLNIKY